TQYRDIDGKNVHSVVLDGTLGEGEISSLREILDSSDFKNAPDKGTKTGAAGPHEGGVGELRGAVMTQLFISRPGKVQEIVGWDSMRTYGPANVRLRDEQGVKILKPLYKWLNKNIDTRKAIKSANPLNPKCAPSE